VTSDACRLVPRGRVLGREALVVGLSCPLGIFFDPEDGRERERLGSCVRCFDGVRVMSWPFLRLDSRDGLPAAS
jgi:hypothetical protein